LKQKSSWLTLGFILGFVALLIAAGRAYFTRYPELNAENLDRFIAGFGPAALGVYALASLLSSPIPFLAPVLSATSGLLFGPLAGALLSVGVATCTSLVPFGIARSLGKAWVEGKLGGRLESIYQKVGGGSAFTFVLLLRLVPVLPWELQNYVAGVTPAPLGVYLLATLLGSAPLTLALALLGSAARDLSSWQFYAAGALALVVLVAPITIAALSRRRKAL
jgi:uncharacterized membrane protein YdjX (TVP38/TMEM64 family)